MSHHSKTRDIYQKQHMRIAGDADAFSRNKAMYSEFSFGLKPSWFEGKKILDAGCGNIGTLMLRFLDLKVSEVHGCDVGDEWIPELKQVLDENSNSNALIKLKAGNLLDLPYEDLSFDFVSVNGVLIHLENMQEVEKGFEEAARTVKRDGYLFTSWGPVGGLMQGVIFPALRQHYNQNDVFKKFIDEIKPEKIHNIIDRANEISLKNGGGDLNVDFLKGLFGEDFCMFLHNFIQAPTWLSNECTPAFVEKLYRDNGFSEIQRILKFTKRKDIRKYFAPIHYDVDSDFARMMYGEGYPIYIGKKV